ncbi:hypothetical protein [Dyella mobilis]|uniref:DUF1579 domain-containing protein n=1 Tax=Dyella mobilis TaxID=1849582 RepID=A0ABS2KCL0_9GAMM|nr:hypothetical protein [Dyella mobilis]MBM7128916.1 hypothetical protein [Dyella mobilis]GLQ99394.1 hypothetical protein GCM10007863_38140 [Dyella mobilis]
MKTLTPLIGFLLVSVCPSVMAGHDGGKDASATTNAASGAPAAQMSLLYPRIGTWQVTIRTMPSKSLPSGGMDKGVATIKKGPGGFSVVQDFWSRGTGGYAVGQSYTWWDGNAKAFKSVWCDNMQGCLEFTTEVDGNSWTVELDGEANGEKVHTTIRATMSPNHNAIHEEVANSYNGSPAKTETVSEYKRVVSGAGQTPQ